MKAVDILEHPDIGDLSDPGKIGSLDVPQRQPSS